ncbi:MAG TPA: acetyl-CoA hydrolase/transferase C-terminal domain-containing protein [Rhizomicrobium sp.]|nr:acetyl-CoA hydrolase/transferase C-terminal domain-containing protein [Rhizomicrobium sp.]
MTARPHILADAHAIADAIVAKVGKKIVLGLPLGLGKAPHIANALYARAAADPSIHLTIFTALTLEKPHYKNVLERRFLEPVIERLFGDWPGLDYAKALRTGSLPANIEVNEFFFLAGQWLRVPLAQQSYISANYTHASRYLIERGVNVIAQLVAKRNGRYSLSGNTDITLDLFRARDRGRANFLVTGQVNAELPFMTGEADLPGETFDYILESPSTEFSLFAPPHEPIGYAEYAIGLHAARLVPDGGTLQIGIGKDGDAVAQALILRHRGNDTFRRALGALSPDADGHLAPFEIGLHGLSEMLVSAFLQLIDAGVLKREVDGALLNAGFFLGPKSFYRALREMPENLRSKIRMRPISFTNQLYEGEDIKRTQRVGARFINSTMMVTLLGAAISDGLEDGRVVSGVGGQYDFFAQAFALPDARAILTLNSTRGHGARATSNVRWSYGHETIPRHLRDAVVSEYGVADLRGRSDAETIAAMLNITASRFQDELLRQAKEAGKIAKNYEIPSRYRENTPERIERALKPFREAGHLPAFPFGSDFNAVEQRLLPALEHLQNAVQSPFSLLRLAANGLSGGEEAALARMQLSRPRSLSDRIYRLLLRGALRE